MRFHQLIYEDYKTAKVKFIQAGVAEEEINKVINDFRKIQNRLTGDQKNIDWWVKRGWSEFQEFVSNKVAEPTKSGLKKKQGDAIVIRDDAEWFIVVPLDHEASCYYGSNTDWCVTKISEPHFSNYFFKDDTTLVYAIRIADNTKWAIAFNLDNPRAGTFYDQKDRNLTGPNWSKRAGLNVNEVKALVVKHADKIDAKRKENRLKDYTILIEKHIQRRGVPRDPILEKLMIIKHDSDSILRYMRKHKLTNWTEGENALLKQLATNDVDAAFDIVYYAIKRKTRWPAFEEAMQHVTAKFVVSDYADYCIKFKITMGETLESIFAQSNLYYSMMQYALKVKGRWPQFEERLLSIANTSPYPLTYNKRILKRKRWPELEKRLLSGKRDFFNGYLYCKEIIKGRWPELEKKMLAAPRNKSLAQTMSHYARYIINGPWPEATPAIAAYPTVYANYSRML